MNTNHRPPNPVSQAQIDSANWQGQISVYRGNDGKECPYTHPTLAAEWRKARFEALTH